MYEVSFNDMVLASFYYRYGENKKEGNTLLKKTPLNKIGKKKLGQGNIYSTFNKPRAKIKPISDKMTILLREYNLLINKLRYLCNNQSELDGAYACYLSDFKVEPHHIGGRVGKLLLNPFNIIMLNRTQHTYYQEHNTQENKQKLLDIVKLIRIKQGF
jgi:hypothetical protein